MHSWKIAEAKQRLSEIIRVAAGEPQIICNRGRPVAAVIAPERLKALLAFEAARDAPTLASRLALARKICAEEGYVLETPSRADRENRTLERALRASRRHQRP